MQFTLTIDTSCFTMRKILNLCADLKEKGMIESYTPSPEPEEHSDIWDTYELTATAPDELNFGKKGDVSTPYVFNGITITKPVVAKPEVPQGNKRIVAYTDGSFNAKNNTAGYAAILTFENGLEKVLSGSITDPQVTSLRNVAGELQAVLEAVKAAEEACADLVVYYDYEGVEKWVTGEWKAKKEFTQKYRDAVRGSFIKVAFHKVAAHTGVEYNERADKLAKAACGM